MRIPHDYAVHKIFCSDSKGEKLTETYFTVTSMLTSGKDELHEVFPPKDTGPSSRTYEIIMLSLCGGIFVLAVASIALKTVRKRVLNFQSPAPPCSLAKDLDAAETGVAYITAKHKDGDQILTAQGTGPVCIRYELDKETPPAEFLTLEAKLDSNTKQSFSLTSSITALDMGPKKGSAQSLCSPMIFVCKDNTVGEAEPDPLH